MRHWLYFVSYFSIYITFGLSGLISKKACTFEKIQEQVSFLKSLTNSPQNKDTFSELPNSENCFYDSHLNVLGNLDFVQHHAYQSQPYVANGYFGARIPNIGHGFTYDLSPPSVTGEAENLTNGWPLFNRRFAGAFVAGFFDSQKNTPGYNFPWLYQYGYDSVISAIPQWTYLSVATDDYVLDPELSSEAWGGIKNYMQNLSLENGIVSTSFTWLDKLQLNYEVLANKEDINLGVVSLVVHNPGDEAVSITVKDKLDFQSSQRCTFVSSKINGEEGLQMVVSPEGLKEVFGAIYSRLFLEGDHAKAFRSIDNQLDVSREIEVVIFPGERLKFIKTVGIYTTDLNPVIYKSRDHVLSAAKHTAIQAGISEFYGSHKQAWSKTLGKSNLIEFPDSPLLTMLAKASIYHINANMREGASGLSAALSVAGLSSDSYGGQVFWDTDLWISMGIIPFNPLVSKSLLNYRLHTREQALKNIESPSRSRTDIAFAGAIYPWTSGRFGNCTATGPCFDYEYHVNAAIAYSAIQLYLSGLVDDHYLETVIFPVVLDAALLFSTYVEVDQALSQYVTKNLTDPDEFAEFVDNGAYTNAAISVTIRFAIIIAKHLGKVVPSNFTKIIGRIHIPYSQDDDNLVLEYSSMNSTVAVKQADVIMMTYPLGNELISDKSAIENLKYYASKQVSTGPAMTFSIFSIVSSAMLDRGCSSESYLLKSTIPFLRGPFAQFSEQSDDNYESNGGTHPAFPFLTAHGGFLQTILMGLLGMRFSYELEGNRIQRSLFFQAKNLELFPKGIKLGEVLYMNTSLSIQLRNSVLTVKNNGPIAGATDTGSSIKIVSGSVFGDKESRRIKTYQTATFKIPKRRKSDLNSLTECNLAQFINLSPGAQGDVVDSMHDGDNSTYWQAGTDGETKFLVNFKKKRLVKGGFINWGDLPAGNLKMYAHFGDHEQKQDLRHTNSASLIASYFTNCETQGPRYNLGMRNQSCVFQEIYSDDVKISQPFDSYEYSKIQVIQRHNITDFEFSPAIECEVILIMFTKSYNDQGKGAKIYDVNFYEA